MHRPRHDPHPNDQPLDKAERRYLAAFGGEAEATAPATAPKKALTSQSGASPKTHGEAHHKAKLTEAPGAGET
jgi:hypothetical protein